MAAGAGCVDAVGYFVLDPVFTAHMSGNSVASRAEAGRADWAEVLRRGFPVPLFLGVASGGVLIESKLRRGHRRTLSTVLGIEAVLLVAFMVGGRLALDNGVVPTEEGAAFYGLVARCRWDCRRPRSNVPGEGWCGRRT